MNISLCNEKKRLQRSSCLMLQIRFSFKERKSQSHVLPVKQKKLMLFLTSRKRNRERKPRTTVHLSKNQSRNQRIAMVNIPFRSKLALILHNLFPKFDPCNYKLCNYGDRTNDNLPCDLWCNWIGSNDRDLNNFRESFHSTATVVGSSVASWFFFFCNR